MADEANVSSPVDWAGSIELGGVRRAALGPLGREDVEASRQLLDMLVENSPPSMLGEPTILTPLKRLAAGMFDESPAEAGLNSSGGRHDRAA